MWRAGAALELMASFAEFDVISIRLLLALIGIWAALPKKTTAGFSASVEMTVR